MLITFSGIVGSGKSTNAKHAYRLLHEWGYSVVYLRFRFLTWRKILLNRPDKRRSAASPHLHQQIPKRGTDSRHDTQLTLVLTLGYLWRMIIFRIFVQVRLRQKIVVVDRFYYDSFVHYTLSSPLGRFYFAILKKMLPTPDLALMLIAKPQILLGRRPHYDDNYIYRLHQRYIQIVQEFPGLVLLETDSVEHIAATVELLIRSAVAPAGNLTHTNVDGNKRDVQTS